MDEERNSRTPTGIVRFFWSWGSLIAAVYGIQKDIRLLMLGGFLSFGCCCLYNALGSFLYTRGLPKGKIRDRLIILVNGYHVLLMLLVGVVALTGSISELFVPGTVEAVVKRAASAPRVLALMSFFFLTYGGMEVLGYIASYKQTEEEISIKLWGATHGIVFLFMGALTFILLLAWF